MVNQGKSRQPHPAERLPSNFLFLGTSPLSVKRRPLLARSGRRAPNRGNVVEDPLWDRIADGGSPGCQGQVATRSGRTRRATRGATWAPAPGRGRAVTSRHPPVHDPSDGAAAAPIRENGRRDRRDNSIAG